MSDTGEHSSEFPTGAETRRPSTDWFVEDNPVESFGSTVERALRQLSVELAGIRAERDGLRLELEGLRAQYEIVRQQLADRDRFAAAVSELADLARNLTLPPGWAHPAPAPTPAPAPAPAHAPVEPAAPPTVVAPMPPPVVLPDAPVAAVPEPPAAPTPSPIVLPDAPAVAPTFAAPATPEPIVADLPAGPDHSVSAFAPPAPDEAPRQAAPAARTRRPMPEPPAISDDTETDLGIDDRLEAGRPTRAGEVEDFFEGPGIWLDEPESRERHVSALSRWGSRLGIVALALFVGAVLFISVGPRFLPYQTYYVRSGSMEPTIETGAMILLTKVDAEDLEVGDIISFKRPDKPDTIVTHRIHAIEANESGRAFVTKGDANGTPDVWRVPATGSGWRYAAGIPKLGFVVGYLGTPIARLALLAVPAGILGVLSLLDIWKPTRSIRARRDP